MLELRSTLDGLLWPAIPNSAGSNMLSVLYQLEQTQSWSPAALWDQQRRQVRLLLEHAVSTVPYYSSLLSDAVSRLPSDFAVSDFSRLPVLSRGDLQREFGSLASNRVPASHGRITQAASSGSTGEPVKFLATTLVGFFWHAFTLREHLWHCRDFRQKMLAIRFGAQAKTESNWFGDVGDSVFATGPCFVVPIAWTFDRQLETLMQEQPAYLLGYPNNLLGVLREAESRGLRMPWLKEVRTIGEAVTPDFRHYIREHWGLPVCDVYSTREAGYLALQCPETPNYHIQSESSIVEIINVHGNPCAEGEIGRVVVTPLHNFAMPLIRYEPGDYAEVGASCSCGRGLPTIRRIWGRSRNALRLPGGKMRWPVLGTTELLDVAPVRKFQVIQKSLTEIEVSLAVYRRLNSREIEDLRAHFTRNLGHDFVVRFNLVDDIPMGAGGKFEDFVSEVID